MLSHFTAIVAAAFSLSAPDLSDPAEVREPRGEGLVWVENGRSALPVVADVGNADAKRAAEFLRDVVFEMTGAKPEILKSCDGPAVRISASHSKDGSFTVRTVGGSLLLDGNGPYAAYDFAERVLGVRQYFDPAAGGRDVVATNRLVVPALDYSDRPVYPMRKIYPFPSPRCVWMAPWKVGDELRVGHSVHQPRSWCSDTNFNYRATRPEIFERTSDGRRGAASPMLCYGSAKTLETYVERIDEQLAGGRDAGGIVSPALKTITVSQWDSGLCCTCEDCSRMKTDSLGPNGTYSPVMWGHFVPKLSDIAMRKYPGYTISVLPYHNTCELPPGTAFTNGNVVAWLVTHPGLAMFKDPDVRRDEEAKIRAWAKATGRKVVNWHYLCYPQEFTSLPILFGRSVVRHYRDMRDAEYGTFVDSYKAGNGRELSAYVWMHALWNPEIDPEKVYDVFAERMFRAAARPMREFMRMQEDGWERKWPVPLCSNKNIFERSFPRADVERMLALAAEARAAVAGDALAAKRVEFYLKPFERFFKESEEYASGGAFAPLEMMKAFDAPKVDGRLDDACWEKAKALNMVEGLDKALAAPSAKTEVRAVWIANGGVYFGVRCHEPNMAAANRSRPPFQGNETVELFFDPSGQADGGFYQICADLSGAKSYLVNGQRRWDAPGVDVAVAADDDGWNVEAFVPFSAVKDFAGAQIPTTAAGSNFWIGNVCRIRIGPRADRKKMWDIHRLFTRFKKWNKDPAAFGKFVFREW